MRRNKNPRSLFDETDRLDKLSRMSDPLEKLNKSIDWKLFEPTLEANLPQKDRSKGGRPPYDRLLMFKILILQTYYGLSDDRVEYQILDRLSFMRFLGLTLSDRVPDSKTVWDFRNRLTNSTGLDQLFDLFGKELESSGLIANKGSLVDATIVDAPKQRNSRKENDQIKRGEQPSDWSSSKSAQKDVDARWTKKNNQNLYGYKNHVKVDNKSKLITNCEVTAANEHDSQVLEELLEDTDSHHELYADSAYRSEEIELVLKEKNIKSRIHEKGKRNNPLTEKQQASNKKKSKKRVRVEHVFGWMSKKMGGIKVQVIGLTRSTAKITLMNLTYNMDRYAYLTN